MYTRDWQGWRLLEKHVMHTLVIQRILPPLKKREEKKKKTHAHTQSRFHFELWTVGTEIRPKSHLHVQK